MLQAIRKHYFFTFSSHTEYVKKESIVLYYISKILFEKCYWTPKNLTVISATK